jgi:UPF0042 nucleotide-binding protein
MRRTVQLVIISGLSGSGKTLALHILEDVGFFCIDNLPPSLLPAVTDLFASRGGDGTRLACAIDVRAGALLVDLPAALDSLRQRGVRPQLVWLESSEEALVNRFKETRRKHPLHTHGVGILESLRTEREQLVDVRGLADLIIDTTEHSPRTLTGALETAFGVPVGSRLTITIVSFGFKYGLPLDADLVFDVRFLANPHYVRDLRWHDGHHAEVIAYVHGDPLTSPFMQKLTDLVEFSIPQYLAEGKAYLTIAIGCTGGRHRSVVIGNDLAEFLRGKGFEPAVQHRDSKR